MSRICIVTPDTVGPVTNGGVGTHCYNLAIFCAEQGHDVTLLFTGPCQNGTKDASRAMYAAKNVNLCFLDDYPPLSVAFQLPDQLCHAVKVFHILRDTSFDQIHFQEWQANGFFCVQAKRTMGLFSNTLLTVTTHSSTEWIQEGMQLWNSAGVAGTKVMWAERYCVEHCDYHISPSHAMLLWLEDRKWKLPAKSSVVPNIFYPTKGEGYLPQQGVIAFFGRLETRKGLEIFCQGLLRLSSQARRAVKTILFVGKEGTCEGQSALDYIRDKLGFFAERIESHCNLDTFAAQQLLRQRKACIFLPSLMDNLPFCGIECAVGGMPVMASNVGGFPEIFAAEQLFEPTAQGVAGALERVLHAKWRQLAAVYDPQRAFEGWKDILELRAVGKKQACNAPLVSVCMPYFNHGAYLCDALESLASQDYKNFEVIVIDDGSTDPESQRVFSALRQSMDDRFHFVVKDNEGPAITRNTAVHYARGEYIIFCDADNVFEVNMISSYISSLIYSDMDILSCHYSCFTSTLPNTTQKMNCCFAPLGADIATSIVENVLGDTNFIVKKSVFLELNGFKKTKSGCEDWDFLTRAVLTGKHLDVVPVILFNYRVTGSGVNSITSPIGNHKMVLENFSEYMPYYAYRALRDLLASGRSASSLGQYESSVIVNAFVRYGICLEKIYARLCPAGSFLQRCATALRRAFVSLRDGR